ncbi:MAG: hypothetical protein ABIX01_08480 [Chitinophagaceae bacterium]
MKIIFLCGAMEPGRDGVGDYIRRLAGELIRQDHQVAVIAINDRHIQAISDGFQDAEGAALPVLRLPVNLVAKARFELAKKWISTFQPDWISLQFVPFAFHPKGLAFGFSRQLTRLGNTHKWHIMFHELWVGMDKESGNKFACWGWLQRRLIHSIKNNLAPKLVHTQTRLYQTHLNKMGFKAQYLPLCSNIPNTATNAATIDTRVENTDKKNIVFVMFGGIHPGAPVESFAKEAAGFAAKANTSIHLLIIGRCGKEQAIWEAAWIAAGLPVTLLGEQTPERISLELSRATIGVSTTPIELAEKSGSVAAMQSHGLPVVCVSQPWEPRGLPNPIPPEGVMEYHAGNFESCMRLQPPELLLNSISEISGQLYQGFLAAN